MDDGRLRRVALVLLAMVVVALGSLPPPASAQTSGSTSACSRPYTASNVESPVASAPEIPAEARDGSLTARASGYDVDFGQERSAARLEIIFDSDPALPGSAPADPVRVEAELLRKGRFPVQGAVVPSSRVIGGSLAVLVCIDPDKVPAGEHAGRVIVNDPRLPIAEVPFTVTLQYPLAGRAHWWLLYAAALVLLGMVVAWVAHISQLRKADPLRPAPNLVTFAGNNWVAGAFGLAALLAVVVATFWRDTTWAGDFTAWVDLTIAALPAVVAAITAKVLVSQPLSPSTAVDATAPAPVPQPDAGAPPTGAPDAPPGRAPATGAPDAPPGGAPSPPQKRASRAVPWMIAGAAALVLVVAVFVVGSVLGGSGDAGSAGSEVVVGGDDTSELVVGGGDGPGPSSTMAPGSNVVVPSVFDLPSVDGLARLQAAGLVAFPYRVCSSSVSEDRIRQVLRLDGTVLVDSDLDGGQSLPAGTTVEVKVSNGRPC